MTYSYTPKIPSASQYDPHSISQHFDESGLAEWQRLVATPVDEVSLHVHTHYLAAHIRPGWRVLEIGAGAGRFTQVLARLGARILVADISTVQLELNRQHAHQTGRRGIDQVQRTKDTCIAPGLASYEVFNVRGGGEKRFGQG